jgi:comEA protein
MHFTQTQRKAILFLIAIFTLIVAYHYVDQIVYRPEPFDFSQFDEEFDARKDSIEKLLEQDEVYDNPVGSESEQSATAPKTEIIVNINSASLKELATLPRIGPVIARRIIDYRNQNGGFTKKEDIMEVRGIGEKTYESLKGLISVE